MRIAFHAPLKPPDHPVPSGDRHIARLLIEALRLAGHDVTVASGLRSRDGTGDAVRQRRLAALGARLAQRYLRGTDPPPELWFTYHLYDRAPDHLGPPIARALGIPYVVAEASLAPGRANGAWAAGHESVVAALRQAAAVIGLNPTDEAGVLTALPDVRRYHALPPFLDLHRFSAQIDRASVALSRGLDPDQPWLVALAMMRPGAKLASYRALAAALMPLADRPWQLLVIGDGAARPEIVGALVPFGQRIRFAGAVSPKAVPGLLGAADLLVWPAIGEAFGMALLEAQAAGLPVVAGASGGVASLVADTVTGLLAPPGDVAALSLRIAMLLDDPARRQAMGAAARARVAARHGLPDAARRLDAILQAARCAS
jgi:glycosyltransferase involved in cell wall biosynthesis